jgi:hypothetical protein
MTSTVLTVSAQLLGDGFKPAGATKWVDMEDCAIEVEQNPWDGMGETIDALDYNLLEASEQLEDVNKDVPQGPPPGVMPVVLPDGHVVEMLQAKPSSIKWGLVIEEHNNALYIKNIKEEGYWYSMLGSKYIGWYIHCVRAEKDPKEMKAVLRAHITHGLRFQLGPAVRAPPPPLLIEVSDDNIEIYDDNVVTEVDDIGDERCLDGDLKDVEWFNSRFTFCKCCYKWHRRFAVDDHVYHQAEDMEDYQELLESASLDVRDIFHGLAKDGIVLPDYALAEVNSIEYNVFTGKRLRLKKVEDQLWWKDIALATMMPATRFYGYNLKHP